MPLPNCSHYVISTIHKNGKVNIVEIDFNKTSFEQVKELYPDIHAGEYYSSFVNRYYSPTEGYVYCREILASEASLQYGHCEHVPDGQYCPYCKDA